MFITLDSLTSLRIIRSLRSSGQERRLSNRCDITLPDPSPTKRWRRRLIAEALDQAGLGGAVTDAPIDVLVTSKETRIRAEGLRCAFRTGTYPPDSFVDLGDGLATACPELTFVELARVMEPAVHLMLGMELCGRFSRDGADPRDGAVCYDIEPITTVQRLRTFAEGARWIRGAERALETIDRIVENAWSPMEAVLATLAALPPYELGYDLWPLKLNPRKRLGEKLASLSDAQSRVPDLMFAGSNVGLNYDGEDHFGLGALVEAAVRADRNPGDAALAHELEEAIAHTRRRIVADKRRDRDLLALGLTIFSVTKEDLEEQGGLDHVMGQVIEAIEQAGARDLSAQRRLLESEALAHARQDLIWSLMPGSEAQKAHKRLKDRESRGETRDYVISFDTSDGQARVLSIEEV
ncbi:MAG: hypothetical protein IJ092_13530 [Atopobiaceae bacterium]|nr:hypothetical protein [Atopobiaceae bacterium]MBR1829748.1 hypothetical protein [Atopobiaceae bacterium]